MSFQARDRAENLSRAVSGDAATVLLYALNSKKHFSSTAVNVTVKQCLESSSAGESVYEQLRFIANSVTRSEYQDAADEIKRAGRAGILVLHLFDPEYPILLREIADPPLTIFVRGSLNKRFAIGIVGARRGSNYALNFAQRLARTVASRGGTVVSGMAWGIDSAAHRGALEGAGQVRGGYPGIAVLGSGVLNIQPRSNERLAAEFLETGGSIVSEYGLTRNASSYFFPRRNRIISGLSQAVVVVEAAARSGSLITARLAAEQGRDVYAVPGSPGSEMSKGANKLIKDGAIPLLEFTDVFDSIPRDQLEEAEAATECSDSPANDASTEVALLLDSMQLTVSNRKLAQQIIGQLRSFPYSDLDYLHSQTGAPIGDLLSILGHLEVEGAVATSPGGLYQLRVGIDS